MLKLLANQRKTTTVLLRACLPAVVSSNLCNARILKNCRRNMSDNHDPHYISGKLPSAGHFRIWSLISNMGDSLMTLAEPDVTGQENRPGIKCSGSYGEKSSLISLLDSTVFPHPLHTLLFTSETSGKRKFYLSVIKGDDDNYVIITKPVKLKLTDNERFIPWRHGSYSMFESRVYRDRFLGSNRDGTVDLIDVHDKRHPDPRVLFLMHSQIQEKP